MWGNLAGMQYCLQCFVTPADATEDATHLSTCSSCRICLRALTASINSAVSWSEAAVRKHTRSAVDIQAWRGGGEQRESCGHASSLWILERALPMCPCTIAGRQGHVTLPCPPDHASSSICSTTICLTCSNSCGLSDTSQLVLAAGNSCFKARRRLLVTAMSAVKPASSCGGSRGTLPAEAAGQIQQAAGFSSPTS